MTWDVVFDDGDEGIELCLKCVRPFVPYAIGESLEVSVDEYGYTAGRVVAVYPLDDTFDIELEESAKVLTRVQTMHLRRRSDGARPQAAQLTGKENRLLLTVNARVLAMFPGGEDEEWYPGTITQLNPDGTFGILYDDGDFAPSVRRPQLDLIK